MNNFKSFLLIAAVAVLSTACGSSASNASANSANAAKPAANANSNAAAAKPVAAAPSKESIMAIEKSGWEAWKARDGKAMEDILSDKYVGFSAAGRMDKAASIKSNSTSTCKVNSYSWSDEQMKMIGSDVAVLTFKSEQDYTCDGKKGDTGVISIHGYGCAGSTRFPP